MITNEFRPASFEDMAGQGLNKNILKSIVDNPENAPRSLILQGPFGTGKCVSRGTYIKTKEGLRRIEDLFEGLDLEEDSFYESDLEVLIEDKEEQISDLYYSGVKDSIKLNTELGLNIEGSKRHPVLVWDEEEFKGKWKRLDDIEVGDCIVMDLTPIENIEYSNEEIPYFKTRNHKIVDYKKNNSKLTYTEIAKEYNTTESVVGKVVRGDYNKPIFKMPQNMSRELSYFLGLIVGDDSYINAFSFHSADDELLEFVSEFIEDTFNSPVTGTRDKRRDYLFSLRMKCHGEKIMKWLDMLGMKGCNSDTKKVPDIIRKTSWGNQLEFVRGVMDSDGSVSKRNGNVELSLNTEDVINFVRQIALSLGIQSTISRRGKSYRVKFRKNKNMKKLFSLKRKLDLIQLSENELQSHINRVPGSLKLAKKIANYKWNKWQMEEFDMIGNLRYQYDNDLPMASYQTFQRFLKENRINDLPEINNNYYFNKVESIEESRSELFDLTNPDSHSFVANGFIVHNTTSARIFARALNCEEGGVDPCGECNTCEEDIQISPFYAEYDSAVVGNVESIREQRDTFYYSISNGYRVIVFDECHLASKTAQSALLKVIEEAPNRVFFLFCTTDVDKLLPTIRSRSLELRFKTVQKEEVIENLKEIIEIMDIEVSDDILEIIALRSRGHVRNAHMYLDQFLMIGEDDFKKSVKTAKAGFVDYFLGMVRQDKEMVFKAVDELLTFPLADLRIDFQQIILDLIKVLVEEKEGNEEEKEIVKNLSSNLLRLIKQSMSQWVINSFESDANFKACMLSLYQMMSSRLKSSGKSKKKTLKRRAMKK